MSAEARPWTLFCRALAEECAFADTRRACGGDGGDSLPFNHRWEHVQQVVANALWLAHVTGADSEIVEAAAWLHDIHKGETHHAAAAADAAPALLARTDFPPHKVAAVADAIRCHEGLTHAPDEPPMEPLESAVLWDADKLTKVGVQALAYSLSACWFDGMTLAERRRSADDFVRTVLSRTVASFNTAPARAEGFRRHAAMLAALEAWEREETPGQ